MDYEKLHKDTVTKLQQMVNSGKITVEVARGICADFIPESEDEKIRKSIIAIINNYVDNSNTFKPKMIAWLEKQAEQSQYWEPSEEQLEALDYAYNSCPDTERSNYYEGVLGTIIDDLHKLSEKLGEQKPANKVEPKFKVGDVVRSSNDTMLKIVGITDYCYNCVTCATNDEYSFGFNIQDEFELVEQKPWSEEDETTKNNISHIIRQYDKISKRDNQPCCYVGDCLLWMQNIRDRVQPQPKQEWSEQDKTVLNNLIYALANDRIGNNRDEYVDWLKSIRPQNTWKPSLSQLNALGVVAKGNAPDDIEEIESLYNDLKKLKG